MEAWEQLLLGAGALVFLFLVWPRARRAAKEAPPGTREDWMGLLKPIGAVVAFVIVLILLVSD